MSILRELFKDALKELGKTPKQIRESLQKAKCKGRIVSHDFCVIAVYLRKKFKKYDISVTNTDIEIFAKKGRYLDNIHTSKTLSRFLLNFDNKEYPELLLKKTHKAWKGSYFNLFGEHHYATNNGLFKSNSANYPGRLETGSQQRLFV